MNPSLDALFSWPKARYTRLESWLRWKRKKKELDREVAAIGLVMSLIELPPELVKLRDRNNRLWLKMIFFEQRKKSKCF